MKTIFQFVLMIVYLISQCNFSLARSTAIQSSANLDKAIKRLENYYHGGQFLSSFIKHYVHRAEDRLFLLNKISENKLENGVLPKIKTKRTPTEYVITIGKGELLKINRFHPNLAKLNGKNIDLEKFKNIYEIYDFVTKSLGTETSWFNLIVPKAHGFTLLELMLVVAIIGAVNQFVVEPIMKKNRIAESEEAEKMFAFSIFSFKCENALPKEIKFKSGVKININYNCPVRATPAHKGLEFKSTNLLKVPVLVSSVFFSSPELVV